MWEKLIEGILPTILEKVSPEIRELLTGLIMKLRDKARQTENPFDDAAVALLAAALGIKFKG